MSPPRWTHRSTTSRGWTTSTSTGGGAGLLPSVANPLTARMHKGINTTLDEGQTLIANGGGFDVAHALRAGTHDGSHQNGGVMPAVAFDMRGRDGGAMPEGPHETANIRAASGGSSRSYVAQPWAVRRLTPRECERLQGFPDDFTRIPWRGKPADQCPDGPRYKALGNSWAVNVAEWLGERIQEVDSWPCH